jgi:hypothetical protein
MRPKGIHLTIVIVATITIVCSVREGGASPQAPGVLFDPLHQRPLVYIDKAVAVKLRVAGERLSVDVESPTGTVPKHVALPADMAQANEIRLVQPKKLVVVGMFSGDVWEIAILDLDRWAVSDKFLCYEPKISPNGEYISFVKFFPAHAAEGAEDHYMIYNLMKDAPHNRPLETAPDDWQTVGETVYPVGIGNHDFDNVRRTESLIHVLSSDGFFWNAQSDQLVFADAYQGRISIISVEIRNGVAVTSALETPVNLCEGKDPALNTCSLRLIGVGFDEHAEQRLRLTFRGVGKNVGVQRELHVDLSQFLVLGRTKI